MSTREYDDNSLFLLEQAVSMVQGLVSVDEVNTEFAFNSKGREITIRLADIERIKHRDYQKPTDALDAERRDRDVSLAFPSMSREEALEQLMEWCALELQTLREPKAFVADVDVDKFGQAIITVAGTELTKVKTYKP